MSRAINMPPGAATLPLTHGIVDDFTYDLGGWTDGGDGAIAFPDIAGGDISLTTGTTANNEHYRHTTAKTFLPATNKPLVFESSASFVDASGATGAVAFGVTSKAGANLIADGGLSVASGSQTSFLFVKLTGESNWRCYSKVGSTELSTLLSATNSDNESGVAQSPSSTKQKFRIELTPNATDCLVAFLIDDTVVCYHTISLSGAVVAACVPGYLKTTNTTEQTLAVDYVQCWQAR